MKEIQEKVKKFCEKYNIHHGPEFLTLDIQSELGEVAKEILKSSDYGNKTFEYKEEIKSEIGDLLYSLITLSNHFNIDLDAALNLVLKKYEKRLKKGSAGSENN